MKKQFYWNLFLCGIVSVGHSQQVLQGIVRDKKTGIPIDQVDVQLIDFGQQAKTNNQGQFYFEGDFPEELHVRFSAELYKSVDEEIIIPALNYTLFLESRHLDMDEITVSGTSSVARNKNPFHIEVYKLSDINAIQRMNLGELISQIPGVYQSNLGNGISKPIIRGMQGMRVVTSLNGMRIESQQWGGDHGMGIGELGIGSVEVIKGPASILYGADALGGVIYLADESYSTNGSQQLTVKQSYNSNTQGIQSSALFKKSTKKYRTLLGASYANHADFQLPSGKYAKNSRFNELVLKSSLSWNKNRTVNHLRYTYSNTVTGIPGDTHESLVTPESFQVDEQLRKYILPAQFFGNHILSYELKKFTDKNEYYLLVGQSLNQLIEYDEKVTVPALYMQLFNTSYQGRWKYKWNEKIELTIGAQGMFQVNLNNKKAVERLIPNALTADQGIFGLVQWNLSESQTLQFGLRYDLRYIKSLDSIHSIAAIIAVFQRPNATIGWLWNKDDTYIMRTSLSTGYRAPHLSELLANGFHHGALRYEIGSVSLKAENAIQLDYTLEYQGEHGNIVLNPFIGIIQNYIYLQPADSIVDGIPVFYYQQMKQVQQLGADLSWHYHPHWAHRLHWDSSISSIYFLSANEQSVSLIPPARWLNTLKFHQNGFKKVKSIDWVVQHTLIAEQNRVAFLENPSKAYQLVHLSVQFIWEGRQSIELNIGVKNVFNELYIDHLSRLKNIGMPAPGRYLNASLKIQLKSKNQPLNL